MNLSIDGRVTSETGLNESNQALYIGLNGKLSKNKEVTALNKATMALSLSLLMVLSIVSPSHKYC
jgi:hypothetical protein